MDNIAKKILKKLYASYKAEQRVTRFPAAEIFRELEIPDGTDLTAVSTSGLIGTDNQENFYITQEGIDHMKKTTSWLGRIAGFVGVNIESVSKTKKTLAALIFAVVVGVVIFMITTGELPGSIKKIIPKASQPTVRVNLTEVQEMDLTETIHDANFLFSTSRNQGVIVAIKNLDFDLLNRAFEGIFVTPDILMCNDCIEYNVEIINAGIQRLKELQ